MYNNKQERNTLKDLGVVVDALNVCSSVTNEHVTDVVSECTASLC